MQITKGVSLHVIQTEKFKDIGISIRFRTTLEKKKAAARSLLALMMCDRCTRYDTKKKMSAKQDMLYGATLNAQTAGYGKAQIVEMRSRILHPRYVEDATELLDELFAFLKEVLFAPLLTTEVFEESKAILKAKIRRMQDDPAQFAITEGLKRAGKNTCLGISALGEEATLDALCLDDVKTMYQEMMEEDVIDILVCGDLQEEKLQHLIKQHLPFTPRDHEVETYYVAQNDLHAAVEKGYRNINQSSIMMVWFTNMEVIDPSYYALRVGNAMFGQYATSLLFQEVREKNSLCYSIFSNLISYDAALGVTTGVEKENIEKTIQLIEQQFQRLCEGDFDDELLKVSKQMIVNSLKASKDSLPSLIALQYQNVLLHTNRNTEDIIALVEAVTREDVISAMKRCEQKMTFILSKEDDDEDNQ